MNQILISQSAGFCNGIKNAIKKAEELRATTDGSVFTMGPLLHNPAVVDRLEDKGIYVLNSVNTVDNLTEKTSLVVRSHGVGEAVLKKLEEKNNVVNATCGFVLNVQRQARRHYDEGYQVVIVGDCNHPEVIGVNGWCFNKAIITKDGSNLGDLSEQRVCLLAQTTETQENFENIEKIIRKMCKDPVVINTICKATSIRQKDAIEMSKKVDKMVIIGGGKSANTKKLYEVCAENCKDTIQIEKAKEIPEEFYKNDKPTKIGVTAGASTPDWVIREAILKMMDGNN